MNRPKSVLAALALLAWSALAQGQIAPDNRPPAALSDLQLQLSNHVARARFQSAAWGVKIVSLKTGAILLDYGSAKLLKPASNAKLFTGALALDRLGPEHRIRTSLFATRKPDQTGTLRGDVIVYGRGDPSLAARFHQGDYRRSLEPLVGILRTQGVKRITGDLIGDDSYFQGPPFGSGWTWDDLQYYYGAEVSALTIQDNVVDLEIRPGATPGVPCEIIPAPPGSYLSFVNRSVTLGSGGGRRLELYRPVGENIVLVQGTLPINGRSWTDAVAVHRPALFFVTLLEQALAEHGITVEGRPRARSWFAAASDNDSVIERFELGSVQSPPLSAILGKMMKPSQNLYAQLLLLQVAAARHTRAPEPPAQDGSRRPDRASDPAPRPDRHTEDVAVLELKKFLAEAGIAPDQVLLEEGSGLSRGALVTPNATVQLLQYMWRHPHAGVFLDSLPVAGVDGTLRNRMRGTKAQSNARAKTGTLRYVNAVSGYVDTAAGEPLVFSIMLNNYQSPDSTRSARADLDEIIVMLAEFTGSTAP